MNIFQQILKIDLLLLFYSVFIVLSMYDIKLVEANICIYFERTCCSFGLHIVFAYLQRNLCKKVWKKL